MTLSSIQSYKFLKRFNGFKDDVFGVQIGEALPPIGPYQNIQSDGKRRKRSEGSENYASKRVRRSNFAEDQFDILEGFGDLLSNTLAINGKACMQRMICEIAEVPVQNLSFMSKILHDIIM